MALLVGQGSFIPEPFRIFALLQVGRVQKKVVNVSLSIAGLVLLLVLGASRCTELPTPEERGNQRPETFLAVDSVRTEQSSQVHIYWYGDDPDGLVVGFLFSWDFRSWYFTRRNDSLFQLRLRRPDSTFQFAVAAVDNSVVWEPPADTSKPIPFNDRNGNGRWDPPEEEFWGLEGAVDGW